MSVPYYCVRCVETLTEDQALCPFCEGEAMPIDDVLEARFAARNDALNARVQSILDAEDRRA